jgi:type IV secretion system protein TrbI
MVLNMQDKQNEFKLKSGSPKIVQLKRPLILTISLIVIFIFVFAVVESFSGAGPHKSKSKSNVTANNLTTTVSPAVEQLPQDYSDVKGIKKYLGQKAITDLPDSVKRELANLKNQQATLQQQLSQLNAAKQPMRTTNNIQYQQAKTSGLFFPGGAPIKDRASQKAKTKSGQSSSAGGSGSSNATEYNKQNMQAQKIKFLQPSDKPEDIYDLNSVAKPVSPYEVQAGTIIPAVLLTAINTTLPGEVVAQVKNDIYDTVTGRFLLIPKGSKVMGQYDSQVSYGQERVLIVFNRVIMPDGSSILLSKLTGAGQLGQAGMEGNVNNHWAKVLGAATLSTMLSVGAGVASDGYSNYGGYDNNSVYYRNSAQNAMLGAAGGVSQAGQQLTSQAMNVQPTLTIPAGYEFTIIVNKDMVMEPFKGKTPGVLKLQGSGLVNKLQAARFIK